MATDAIVRDVAAQALLIPAETLSVTRLAGDASSRSFFRVARPEGTLVAVRYPWPFNVGDGVRVGPGQRVENSVVVRASIVRDFERGRVEGDNLVAPIEPVLD